MTPNCPRFLTIECASPGPRDGYCCQEIPPGPSGFSVHYRNPGHWDIHTQAGRAFRIRGENGNVTVADERKFTPQRVSGWMEFWCVEAAMTYCASQLMNNPGPGPEVLPET